MSCDKRRSRRLAAISGLCLAAGCATTAPPPRSAIHEVPAAGAGAEGDVVRVIEGKATWYGKGHQGGPTASGERFDMYALTAAHKTLRMGTRVRVTNLRNGRTVVVRINDRGPYGRGRVIDLSYAAASKLGMLDAGIIPVRLEVFR
jgi:rare lipoprotein A